MIVALKIEAVPALKSMLLKYTFSKVQRIRLSDITSKDSFTLPLYKVNKNNYIFTDRSYRQIYFLQIQKIQKEFLMNHFIARVIWNNLFYGYLKYILPSFDLRAILLFQQGISWLIRTGILPILCTIYGI